MRFHGSWALLVVLVAAAGSPAQKKADEWGKDVPFTTDWKKAIKTARESGRMLLIYNGWQRPGI